MLTLASHAATLMRRLAFSIPRGRMTVTPDLAASWPSLWERSSLSRADLKRSGASWSGAIAIHLALVAAAIAVVPQNPPPKPQIEDALSVEIVTVTQPTQRAETSGVENGESTEPQASSSAPPSAPATRFDAALQNWTLERPVFRSQAAPREREQQDVLALAEQARRGEPIPEIDPIVLPAGVRGALRTAYYCRSGAMGVAVDRARCPHLFDPIELEARLAALPLEVRQRLAADGMRDPYFD